MENFTQVDADFLLDVRNGCLSLDELVKLAEGLVIHIRKNLYKKTKLRSNICPKFATEVFFLVMKLAQDQYK